jgi:hypothetical protein
MKNPVPRVFVVDDDQSVRTSLANLLAAEDYAVEIFASASELSRVRSLPRPSVPRARRAAAGTRRLSAPTPTHGARQDGADSLYHWARRYTIPC